MATNKLYNFFERFYNVLKENNSFKPKSLVFKKNTENQSCAFYELSLTRPFTLIDKQQQNLKLIEHHLSFFADQEESNPHLSHYHYTAYFENSAGAKYQLHVYFNQKDQLTCPPELVLIESKTKQNLSEKDANTLSQLAVNQSMEIIAEIRVQRNALLAEYVIQFETAELQLCELSASLPENYAAYKSKLDESLILLSHFSAHHDNPKYEATSRLLRRIDSFLSISNLSAKKLIIDEVDAVVMDDPTSSIKVTPSLDNTQNLRTLIEEVRTAKNVYLSAEKEDKLNRLEAFHNLSNEVLLLSEEPQFTPTANELHQLQSLADESQSASRGLLEHYLVLGQLDKASRLKNYINPIPEKLVKLALIKGNAELLDFILTHGDFPINTFIVASNQNPVQYCVTNDAPEKPKAACLAVLIKHGASLMIQGANGLPLAHTILSENANLRQVLHDQAQHTIGQRRFYQNLIQELKQYLNQEERDEETTAKLNLAIEQYTHLSKFTNLSKNPRFNAQIASGYANLHGTLRQLTKKASQDEDVLRVKAEFDQMMGEYAHKLTPHKRKMFALSIKNSFEDVECADDSSYEQQKDTFVRFFTGLKRLFELDMLFSNFNGNAKPSKKALREQRALHKEMMELENSLGFNQPSNPMRGLVKTLEMMGPNLRDMTERLKSSRDSASADSQASPLENLLNNLINFKGILKGKKEFAKTATVSQTGFFANTQAISDKDAILNTLRNKVTIYVASHPKAPDADEKEEEGIIHSLIQEIDVSKLGDINLEQYIRNEITEIRAGSVEHLGI